VIEKYSGIYYDKGKRKEQAYMENINYDLADKQAQQFMKEGKNCCQAVLMTAGDVWDIQLPPGFVEAAGYMGAGMQSGCVCGALSGLIMAAGLFRQKNQLPEKSKPGQELHDLFCKEFGASCCRVLRNKRGIMDKIGGHFCRELTGRATVLLLEHLNTLTPEGI